MDVRDVALDLPGVDPGQMLKTWVKQLVSLIAAWVYLNICHRRKSGSLFNFLFGCFGTSCGSTGTYQKLFTVIFSPGIAIIC